MSQPRYAEYIRIKHIIESWEDFELVDGSEVDTEVYNGGGANG